MGHYKEQGHAKKETLNGHGKSDTEEAIGAIYNLYSHFIDEKLSLWSNTSWSVFLENSYPGSNMLSLGTGFQDQINLDNPISNKLNGFLSCRVH